MYATTFSPPASGKYGRRRSSTREQRSRPHCLMGSSSDAPCLAGTSTPALSTAAAIPLRSFAKVGAARTARKTKESSRRQLSHLQRQGARPKCGPGYGEATRCHCDRSDSCTPACIRIHCLSTSRLPRSLRLRYVSRVQGLPICQSNAAATSYMTCCREAHHTSGECVPSVQATTPVVAPLIRRLLRQQLGVAPTRCVAS